MYSALIAALTAINLQSYILPVTTNTKFPNISLSSLL